MNKDLQDVLDKYIDTFLNQEEVKQYFILEKEIENSQEINNLRKNLKNCQKALALSINDKVKHEECLIKYNLAKDAFDNNPIVNNYNIIKEDIYNKLKDLQDKINDINKQ